MGVWMKKCIAVLVLATHLWAAMPAVAHADTPQSCQRLLAVLTADADEYTGLSIAREAEACAAQYGENYRFLICPLLVLIANMVGWGPYVWFDPEDGDLWIGTMRICDCPEYGDDDPRTAPAFAL
jgi:hypothetical protein